MSGGKKGKSSKLAQTHFTPYASILFTLNGRNTNETNQSQLNPFTVHLIPLRSIKRSERDKISCLVACPQMTRQKLADPIGRADSRNLRSSIICFDRDRSSRASRSVRQRKVNLSRGCNPINYPGNNFSRLRDDANRIEPKERETLSSQPLFLFRVIAFLVPFPIDTTKKRAARNYYASMKVIGRVTTMSINGVDQLGKYFRRRESKDKELAI